MTVSMPEPAPQRVEDQGAADRAGRGGRQPRRARARPVLGEVRRATAGSSSRVSDAASRVSDAISRVMASRSSWSSRPKLCSTLGREVLVAGSHSLWVNCR